MPILNREKDNKKQRGKKERQGAAKRKLSDKRPLISILLSSAIVVVIYFVLVTVSLPQQFDLAAGDIAPQTIDATKTVVDVISTNIKIEQARSAVQNSYTRDNAVTLRVTQGMEETFAAIEESREIFIDYRERQTQIAQGTNPGEPVPDIVPDASLISRLKGSLGEFGEKLSNSDLSNLLIAKDQDYAALRDNLLEIAFEGMNLGIKTENLESEITKMIERASSDARQIGQTLRPIVSVMLVHYIEPNELFDEVLTEMARDAAEADVERVEYKKGQNIVRKGDPITENQLQVLIALGLIKGEDDADFALYIGTGVIVLLLGLTAVLFTKQFVPETFSAPKKTLALGTVIVLQLLMELALRQISPYSMPVHFAVMMIAVLLGTRLAAGYNLLLGLVAGVLATGDDGVFSSAMFELFLMSQAGGLVAVFALRRVPRRTSLMTSGIWVGIANACIVLAVGLMTNFDLQQTSINALYALGGALLSSIAAMGILPLLESAFGFTTNQKLLELSNPNLPLLRQLQIEAPGTYHHSLLVANLAEAAADAVGANALLVRVGAYYHDIGKIKRPQFFKENQVDNINPHDNMQPQVSAAILAAHVRDGRAMALHNKLPQPIVDIIQQHHGTGVMAYFYFRAQKQAEEAGETVAREDYQYDGPRPQFREAAIISLADTVEAAVRSLKDHSRESIQTMIHRLIDDRIHDGELSDVDLTLKDFDRIEKAFMLVLNGIYHTRVEYPEPIAKKKVAEIEEKGELAPVQANEKEAT